MLDQFGRFVPDYNYPRQRQDIVHVNGRGGAEAYQLPPNSNILLLDDTAPIIWLKQTDGAGYPNLSPYSITPYQPEPQVPTSEILERLTRLEEKVNGKSNASASKS